MKRKGIIWIIAIAMLAIPAVLVLRNFGLPFIVLVADIMNAPTKQEIVDLVNEDYTVILDDIKNNNFDNTEKLERIESISQKENYIDLYCGGAGIGSATSYYGFYYSENDSIDDMQNINYPAGEELKPDGSGYSWNEMDGDNRFYVEKIMDNFYYYESHY